MARERYFPIHTSGDFRDAVASDEIEIQTTGGGGSAHTTVGSIANLGGATGPTGPIGPPGLDMIPSPYNFGAVGDGTTDDHVALQAWLDAIAGKIGYGKPGTFMTSEILTIHSGTTIWGAGKEAFSLITKQGVPQNFGLMWNEHLAFPETITSITINQMGTGFAENDTFAITQGTATQDLGGVISVGAGGTILSVGMVQNYGTGYTTANDVPIVATTGSGVGATVDIVVSPAAAREDKNIAIYNTCFRGDPAWDSAVNFLVFIGVDGLTIDGCLIKDRQFIALDMSHCANVVVNGNELTNIGKRTFPINPGTGLPYTKGSGRFNGGDGITCSTPNHNVRITNNNLHDFNGAIGINVNGFSTGGCVVANNIIRDVAEAGMDGFPPDSVVIGNTIENVETIDVSGNGVEVAGNNYVFVGNTIRICGHNCAHFSNIVNVVIANNVFDFPNQEEVPLQACLTINTFANVGEGAFPPENVVISGNQMSGADGKGQALIFTNNSGVQSRVMNDIHICDNNFGPAVRWNGPPMDFWPDSTWIVGDNFIHRNNLGNTDVDPFMSDFPIPSGSSGDITIPVFPNLPVPFRPRSLLMSAIIPSGGGPLGLASTCEINVPNDLTAVQLSTSSASSPNGFYSSTGFGIKLYDGDATLFVDASVTAYTNDGFVVTIVGTTTADAFVNFIAYP